jgi:hyperosmotically inducible protein
LRSIAVGQPSGTALELLALHRAIYGHSALQTLAVRALPPIHIIVENGNVTLEGLVRKEADKTVAEAQVNGVSEASSVTNNLRVENQS